MARYDRFAEDDFSKVEGPVLQYYLSLPDTMKKQIHDPVLSKLEILNKGLLGGIDDPAGLNKKYKL